MGTRDKNENVLTLLSWNVRGLRDPIKKRCVRDMVTRGKYGVVCLQETHLARGVTTLPEYSQYHRQYHATFSTYSRGVIVLFNDVLEFQELKVRIDVEGRFVFVRCRIDGVEYYLAFLYVPPPFRLEIMVMLEDFIQGGRDIPLLVMGDFNQVINMDMDRLRGDRKKIEGRSVSSLGGYCEDLGLVDIWRLHNPEMNQFSCYSKGTGAWSRIDLALGNEGMVEMVGDVKYLQLSVSDHAPLVLKIGKQVVIGRSFWKLNPNWLVLLKENPMILPKIREFLHINKDTAPQDIVWDTMKAFIRGVLAQAIGRIKKQNKREEQIKRDRLRDAEEKYLKSPSLDKKQILDDSLKDLKNYLEMVAGRKNFIQQQRYHMEGDRNGKLLARITRAHGGKNKISSIKLSDNKRINSSLEIEVAFRSYYENLYRSKKIDLRDDPKRWEIPQDLPILSQLDRELLAAEITLQELERAARSLSSGKAAGEDGLPKEIYDTYGDILLPELLDTITDAYQKGILPKSMRSATILNILKPGKDPERIDSYRPISLLTSDVKILARVLANRLSGVIHQLVHIDQTGFIPTRHIKDNIRRLYLNLQIPCENWQDCAVIALDASKAFDSIEWDYLWLLLQKYGMPQEYIRWIKLLYTSPLANVNVNGSISSSFSMYRGTRQGCPLSPLLFALAIEPLAHVIRSSTKIKGFVRNGKVESISLYADDMLVYLGDTNGSLTALMEELDGFGAISGLQINWLKSALMYVTPNQDLDKLERVNNLVKVVDSFDYLGVRIDRDLKKFLRDNLDRVLERFKRNITNWVKLPISVVGRINLIKMLWLPKLLYVLQASPVSIAGSYFKKIDMYVRKLIWKGGKSRINLSTLQLPKGMGGLAIPNFHLYYLAAQLQYFWGWNRIFEDHYLNYTIGGVDNRLLVEILESGIVRQMPSTQLFEHIFKIWNTAKKINKVVGFNKFSPIWHNRYIPEIFQLKDYVNWTGLGIVRIDHLFVNGVLRSYHSICGDYPRMKKQFYQYLILKQALKNFLEKNDMNLNELGILGDLVEAKISKEKLISRLYNNLLSFKRRDIPPDKSRMKWEQELGLISDVEWDSILRRVETISLVPRHRLTQLFFIYRSYYTPQKLFQWNCRDTSKCPKCDIEDAGWVHMIWTCPKLIKYWCDVSNQISKVLNKSIQLDIKSAILGIFTDLVVERDQRLLVGKLLFIARNLLASKWMHNLPPNQEEWLNICDKTKDFEKLRYCKLGLDHKFSSIWQNWSR